MRGVRKKSDDADKKLKRFQKLQQKLQHRQQQQQNKLQKQTTPRIEYFKGNFISICFKKIFESYYVLEAIIKYLMT